MKGILMVLSCKNDNYNKLLNIDFSSIKDEVEYWFDDNGGETVGNAILHPQPSKELIVILEREGVIFKDVVFTSRKKPLKNFDGLYYFENDSRYIFYSKKIK